MAELPRQSNAGEPAFSDRGLAYWPLTATDNGERIHVYESSAADSPHIWLGVSVSARASAAVHLTPEQARVIRDQLDAAITQVEARFND
jgi:hypothetical protein